MKPHTLKELQLVKQNKTLQSVCSAPRIVVFFSSTPTPLLQSIFFWQKNSLKKSSAKQAKGLIIHILGTYMAPIHLVAECLTLFKYNAM